MPKKNFCVIVPAFNEEQVIESSLQGFLAQSWQWIHFPSFGSLITAQSGKRTVIGIVHQIQTGSMDPLRYPFPYQKTEEELLREQPQIFEFLKTTFSCLPLGYSEHEKIYYLLSPEPTKIHTFVYPATREQCQFFFAHDQYLHVLFGLANQLFNLDELLLALLKSIKEQDLLTKPKLNSFIETISLLTGNDYRRIKLFLQRAHPIVSSIQ